MEDMQWEISALPDYDRIAPELLERIGDPPQPLLLYGQIGAGKTTLVQALCRQLGITDPVTSPTFALVNEYGHAGGQLYHLDLYRLNTLEEALQIGIEDYLYSGQYCFIEWPELIEPLVPEPHLRLSLTATDNNRRKILLL